MELYRSPHPLNSGYSHFVLSEGKVVESGTHKDLVKEGGVYSKMWKDYITSVEWNVTKEEQNG